jgi:uncharacterized protein (DUF1330 family)
MTEVIRSDARTRRRVMNTKCKVAIGALAGAVLGAAAVQGIYAQAKPKAYIITESEVIDAEGLKAYAPIAQAALRAAGGRSLAPATTNVVVFLGEGPKRVGISEWESMEKAKAWRNSPEWKALSPQRDKVQKQLRSYAIEGPLN